MRKEPYHISLAIPTSTILKLVITGVILYCIWVLWPFLLLLFLAALTAVTLNPVYQYLRKYTSKTTALLIVTFGVLAFVAIILILFIPAFTYQITELTNNLPQLKAKLLDQIPNSWGIRGSIENRLRNSVGLEKWITPLLSIGQGAFGGLAGGILFLALSIYLLADGERIYQWISAFFSADTRKKLDETEKEISKIIIAYVVGKFITSFIATIYAYLVLRILGVPGAFALALLVGILDMIPAIGFIISLVPACLIAASVSLTHALTVAGLFLIFNALENYLIIPRIYGTRLQVAGVIILITMIMATILSGVLGAIAILPVIASYPVIERIWLAKYLSRETLEKHAES